MRGLREHVKGLDRGDFVAALGEEGDVSGKGSRNDPPRRHRKMEKGEGVAYITTQSLCFLGGGKRRGLR